MIIRKGCSDFQKDRNKNRLVLVTVVLFSLKLMCAIHKNGLKRGRETEKCRF